MNAKSGIAIKQLNTAAYHHEAGRTDSLHTAVVQATSGLDRDELTDVIVYFLGRVTDAMHVYKDLTGQGGGQA